MKMTNPNMIRIASGKSHHSDEAVRIYREHWRRQGYELPDWQPSCTQKPKPKDCGCPKRKALMNRVVPGSGDVLEKVFEVTGIKKLVQRSG